MKLSLEKDGVVILDSPSPVYERYENSTLHTVCSRAGPEENLPADARPIDSITVQHNDKPFTLVADGSTAIEYWPVEGLPPNETTEEYFLPRTIFRTRAGSIYLEGFPLRCLDHSNGGFHDNKSELTIVLRYSSDSKTDTPIASCKTYMRMPNQYKCCKITLTNKLPHQCQSSDHTGKSGRLYCRWIHITKTTSDDKPLETIERRLRGHECPSRERSDDTKLREDFMESILQGPPPARGLALYSAHEHYADIFSGGGGSARGAYRAGLTARVVVDSDKLCAATLRANTDLGIVEVRCITVHEFITGSSDTLYRVQVLSISTPCQYWSQAHTVEGRNDDANIAANFCIFDLLKKCRPRVVFLEQTYGLGQQRFEAYYWMIRQQFTTVGYDIRARIVPCKDYGIPQLRRRLIIVATCLGEPLHAFPEATHGDACSLRPVCTIQDALNDAARIEAEHRLSPEMLLHVPLTVPRPPYDPTRLSRTLLTSGDNTLYHPDGTRWLSLNEKAQLQTFGYHRFVGSRSSVEKMIGNAVPPRLAETFFRHLVRCMRAEDFRTWKRRERHLIVLD